MNASTYPLQPAVSGQTYLCRYLRIQNIENKSSPKSFGKSASLSHGYTTKSPVVTTGRPKFTPQLPLPFDVHHPIQYRPTPLTVPNGIRIHSAILPQYSFRTHTDRPTHTQTHRPTDRWDRRQVTPLALMRSQY